MPVTPSLAVINLPEQFTEFRETLAYVSQFIKDMVRDTDEQPGEEMHRVRVGGSRVQQLGSCGVGMCLPPGVDVFTYLEALQTL